MFVLVSVQLAQAQLHPGIDSLLQRGTLDNCVQFALLHHPILKQSYLDEEITDRIISGKLADWYPQLNLSFSLQHNPQLPVSVFQGNIARVGIENTSAGLFTLTQTIFNRDVLLASSTASDVRERMRQKTVTNKIDVVITVSKAYYAVLVTKEHIGLLDEQIVRLERSLQDAYNQYRGGVVDKIDYERATIALNNAKAERKQNEELLKARYVYLKEQMGYPPNADLNLEYEIAQMEPEAFVDTTETLKYDRRIEYQLHQTQRTLQEANVRYNEWSFLPSLSAYGGYSLNYLSSGLPRLYDRDYSDSYVGLQLSFPIFQGGKRWQQVKQAELELQRFDYDELSLENSLSTEYAEAIADYKGNLNMYTVLKENLVLAQEVYRTVQLQYKSGTKSYLEVIIAENDLRTAQVNSTDALYQVLSSKLDFQKALGTIRYQ